MLVTNSGQVLILAVFVFLNFVLSFHFLTFFFFVSHPLRGSPSLSLSDSLQYSCSSASELPPQRDGCASRERVRLYSKKETTRGREEEAATVTTAKGVDGKGGHAHSTFN